MSLDRYDPDAQPLCFEEVISYPPKCKYCQSFQDDPYGVAMQYYDKEYCECSPDPICKVQYTDVLVSNPAPMAPRSTVYHVHMYRRDTPASQVDQIYYNLDADDVVASFVLDFSEDPRDLEKLHGKFIKAIGSKFTPYERSFKGKASRASYMKDLLGRLSKMKEKHPEREQSDNPHVSRKKG